MVSNAQKCLPQFEGILGLCVQGLSLTEHLKIQELSASYCPALLLIREVYTGVDAKKINKRIV